MCPACWATALTTFFGAAALTAVAIAATDRLSLAVGAATGIGAGLSHWNLVVVPWTWYAVVAAGLLGRVAYLLVVRRDGLMPVILWQRALRCAKRRCPSAQQDGQFASGQQ